MRSSSWLISRLMRRDSDIGPPSQMLTSIDGIEGSGFKPRVARVLSYGEADGDGSGGEGEVEDGHMTRPSSQATGGIGEG